MKQIICNAKAKTVEIKSKAEGMRAQLLLFSSILMLTGREKKKLKFSLGLGAIADKIRSIFNLISRRQRHDQRKIGIDGEEEEEEEQSPETTIRSVDDLELVNEEEDKYPDLRHSVFEKGEDYDNDDDDLYDLGDPNRSVIDMVRDSKEEGEKFSLEDEIDHVADLFILKVHKNMRMQKLDSFKRYQQLLERSS